MAEPKFIVFYSWQSDLPKTRSLISKALEVGAKAAMLTHPSIKIVVDQATRDLPGAPNIPIAIMTKIRQADMVVADITTINPESATRKSANPNVIFELGFAVALLGWERMTLMFDQSVGNFPDDIPFDFDRHRASPFATAAADKGKEAKRLSNLMRIAIESIIDKDPARPTAELTPEQVKHQHDVEQLKWLLSYVHIPSIDDFIAGMPHRLTDKALHMFDGLNGVVAGSYFHLYDQPLLEDIRHFYASFAKTLGHAGHYHETSSLLVHVFTGHDGAFTADQQKAWTDIEQARDQMEARFAKILNRVRSHYLEVDLQDSNRLAWEDYVKHRLAPEDSDI